MNKTDNNNSDGMLPEYDLKGKKGTRGKYAKDLKEGYSLRVTNEDGTVTEQHFVPKETAIVLEPDVKIYFPDSDSVNRALRGLIDLLPEKSSGQVSEPKEDYGESKT